MKAFKFRLYPTKSQIKKIINTFELCRVLYNSALQERISYYKTFKKSLSYPSQASYLKDIRILIPEYKSIYAQVLQSTLKRVDLAYQNFFRRIKQGENPGFPRFKNKNQFNSILYPQNGFSIKENRNSKWTSIFISKIGHIPMLKHRNIQGKIKNCQILKTATDKYYIILTLDEVPKELHPKTNKEVGIDLGIKTYITLSNGKTITNPKYIKASQEKLKKAQQKLSKLSNKDSSRKAIKLHIARIHEKIVNQRQDFIHKVSNKLIKEYDIIYLENLNIKNMLKSNINILNKYIQDASWSKLIQYLIYKAGNADKLIILVNPANTSKMCSSCNKIVKKKLEDRIHECKCGLKIDRDLNAAINIYNLGKQNLLRENRDVFSEEIKKLLLK